MRFPKPTGRRRDRAYLLWVKSLPCLFAGEHGCRGATEAHHAGRRPHNRKCDDTEVVPLCPRAHRDYEYASGVFKGMDLYARRAWAERAIAITQALWAQRGGVAGNPLPQRGGSHNGVDA